jgi:hypothetical protein
MLVVDFGNRTIYTANRWTRFVDADASDNVLDHHHSSSQYLAIGYMMVS